MTKRLPPDEKAARAATRKKPGPSPKTHVDPAIQKRICDAIALGATYELAAKYGGIGKRTFYDYLERYPAFVDAIADAEGRAVVGWLAKIEKAANEGSWQAVAWKLERRYPGDYGRTVQEQRHTNHAGDGPVEVRHGINLSDCTDEELAILERVAAKAALARGDPAGT